MVEASIVALLLASPAITNLVATRILPAGAPQALTYPFLTYATVSDVELTHSNDGRGNLREARMQFDCWGQTLLQANQLAQALVRILNPRRTPDQPWSDLRVDSGCVVHNGREAQRITFDEPTVAVPNQPAARPQRIAYDFRFQYHLTE